MKKLLCILFACLLMIGTVAALPTAAATDPMVEAFGQLIWFDQLSRIGGGGGIRTHEPVRAT